MKLKEYLKSLLDKRNAEMVTLRDALVNSDNVEERKSINASIDNLDKEIRELEVQINNCDLPATEQRGNLNIMATRSEENGGDGDIYSSLEYRKAFQRAVALGQAVEVREDAVTLTTTTGVSTVIPTNLANYIMEKFEQLGVIYNLVTKTSYPVGLTIPTDGAKPTATWVNEGAGSDAQKKELGAVITFSHHKLRCEIHFTEEVNTMTLPMFEALFVKQVSEAMIRSIESAIVDGAGTASPKGILKETPATAISVEATAGLTYKLLCDVEAAIPTQYEATTKWCMTKKTFMAFMAMTDSNGQPIARVNYGIGGKTERTLLGRDVVLYIPQTGSTLGSYADSVTADTVFAFLCDFGEYMLNTNYNLGVQRSVDWENENHRIKAVLACDGKMLRADSLITLTKKKPTA